MSTQTTTGLRRPVSLQALDPLSHANIVETVVHDMPGVPDRDTSLDFLEDMMPG